MKRNWWLINVAASLSLATKSVRVQTDNIRKKNEYGEKSSLFWIDFSRKLEQNNIQHLILFEGINISDFHSYSSRFRMIFPRTDGNLCAQSPEAQIYPNTLWMSSMQICNIKYQFCILCTTWKEGEQLHKHQPCYTLGNVENNTIISVSSPCWQWQYD